MDGNTCLTFERYIMTSRFRFSSARTAQNPWRFSSCSVEYFSDFIDDLIRQVELELKTPSNVIVSVYWYGAAFCIQFITVIRPFAVDWA